MNHFEEVIAEINQLTDAQLRNRTFELDGDGPVVATSQIRVITQPPGSRGEGQRGSELT